MIPERVLAPPVVVVPAGAFVMGESAPDKFVTDTERPGHRVELDRPFGLGAFPVTVGEYRGFAAGHAPEEPEAWPVVHVSWDEARAYCGWLAGETGEAYRLPSEAEWEYACRAGSAEAFSTGGTITLRGANFLYSEDGQRVGSGHRSAVGTYPANAFGLHDLHGNVCEWVEDAWHADYRGAPADGSAWMAGGEPERRVIRGGAWDYLPRLLRSAWRDSMPRSERRDNVGFRVALTLPA